MAAVPTMLVKEGKVEKVINVTDFDPNKHKEVERPHVEVSGLENLSVPMSSGQHAALQAHVEYVKAAAVDGVPSMADVTVDEDGEDVAVLTTVVDETNLPKDVGSVKSLEEISAEIETANADVDAQIDQATEDAKAQRGGRSRK